MSKKDLIYPIIAPCLTLKHNLTNPARLIDLLDQGHKLPMGIGLFL